MERLFSVAGGLLLAALAFGQAAIKANEEADWPPFTPPVSGKVSTGLSLDLVTELGKRLGVSTSLESFPMTRVQNNMAEGTYDLVTVISVNAEREKIMVFSDVVLEKVGLVFANAASPVAVASYDDLKGKLIGTVKGNSYGADFDAAVKRLDLKLDESADLATMLRKLAIGRVGVGLGVNIAVAVKLADPEFKGKIVSTGFSYVKSTYHFGLSKKSPWAPRLADVNKALAAMKADGTLKKLMAAYGL